ncbi:uncharacterized protein LOC133182500 [Saccostrea echinata]|uniref:uncharacterized protein LOC133182500 n=1 Tax=Saccostrea echinata TaxID=191078 RepID=UPI002A7F7779|nr:uncharacterized protein LOC133182500 [Saccostrea echinata]
MAGAWLDDPHLSFLIADNLLNAVGDPRNQRLKRHIMDVMDRLMSSNNEVEIIRSGGCAEGFRMQGTDVDQMHVIKKIKVVTNIPKDCGKYRAVVRMIKSADDPPGYVKLIILTPFTPLGHIRNAMKKVGGEYYLMNEAFLRTFQISLKEEVRHGPCVLETDEYGTDHDRAYCLEYKGWPICAEEWVRRKREYGWPSKELISRIKNTGCHVMAVGSKKINLQKEDLATSNELHWTEDPLQWRLSFSVAEKKLVYAFNDTQFLTYGIFKLLNRELFSKDPIVMKGICSYFLKTALFWTIEQTPSEYWKPERLVFCVSLCFQRLIAWMENGFCPNYFVRENNMFLGKVQEWQLAYISTQVSEIYREGWRCLLRCHSLFHLKTALEHARRDITPFSFPISNPEEDFRILRSSFNNPISDTRKEMILDSGLFSEILARQAKLPSVEQLELELKNSLTLEVKEKYFETLDIDILKLCRYQTFCKLALFYLNISLTETKSRSCYKYIRKAFSYLNYARFADISKGNLTLATAYYCLGRFTTALDHIKQYEEILENCLGYTRVSVRHGCYAVGDYEENFCGRQMSSLEKASVAVSYDFEVYRMMPLVPIEIALEIFLMKNTESRLVIPPKMYSVFLKILCHSNLCNLNEVQKLSQSLKDCPEEIHESLQKTNTDNVYLKYIMLAVTAMKLGNYEEALRYYCLAHNSKRRLMRNSPNCPEWQTRTSGLFYIAQLLRILM